MKIKNQRHQSGFALMEILVAMAILGVGFSFILMSDKISWNTTKSSIKMLKAGHLIEKNIEQLRIHISSNPAANFPPTDTSFTEDGITFQRKITTAYSPKTGTALSNIRKLEITTAWGSSVNDSLNIQTYISRDF